MSGISKTMGRLKAWAAGNTHYGHQAATDTLELITAYEESQEANAELLAALKPFAKDYEWYLRKGIPADAISASLQLAHQVCDKHKGESDER